MSKNTYSTMFAAVVAAAFAMTAAQSQAAESASSELKERALIETIQSKLPPQDKAIPCKQLAIYGSKNAVPALAALLPDKDLSSWARIALEAIPGPEADAALRDALGKLQGRLLIGVINSIGYRRDAKAIDGLAAKLKDADPEVASCAAAALGKIGGEQAVKALEPMLATAPNQVRPAIAEGCILCAEQFATAGNRDEAIRIYEAVRKADVPKQRIIEATRGSILARQAAGVPLLVEQLRSPDKATFAIGLRTARELAVPGVTDALIAELPKNTPERQCLLILALADRGDVKALPVVLDCIKTGEPKVRAVAASVLEQIGNVSCVPMLLEAAAGDDAQLSAAAKTALARLPGKEVDAELFSRLQQSSGKMRAILIEFAEQRRLEGAMAVFAKCARMPIPACARPRSLPSARLATTSRLPIWSSCSSRFRMPRTARRLRRP